MSNYIFEEYRIRIAASYIDSFKYISLDFTQKVLVSLLLQVGFWDFKINMIDSWVMVVLRQPEIKMVNTARD